LRGKPGRGAGFRPAHGSRAVLHPALLFQEGVVADEVSGVSGCGEARRNPERNGRPGRAAGGPGFRLRAARNQRGGIRAGFRWPPQLAAADPTEARAFTAANYSLPLGAERHAEAQQRLLGTSEA